jgi:hypothetical protein
MTAKDFFGKGLPHAQTMGLWVRNDPANIEVVFTFFLEISLKF